MKNNTAGFSNLISGNAASGFNSTRRGFKRSSQALNDGKGVVPMPAEVDKKSLPRTEKNANGGINVFLKKLINKEHSPEEILQNTQSSGGLDRLQHQKNSSFNQLKEQNRLIKINRGKKKLETARRSRL